ncbi:hypothetical protein CSPAE12_02060 [Colletotrichum incanum]|nr:hypothetical protein CSPAE12_02060 [Colletotrichum incanum]
MSDQRPQPSQIVGEGDPDRVRTFVDQFTPTLADLSYTLEEACQNLQLEVVRFLLRQSETQLRYRCFRRCVEFPEDDLTDKFDGRPSMSSSQSIFTSGNPTIARDIIGDPYFSVIEQRVQRLKGHILEMAVNLGATEAVTLLVSRGAKLEYGIPVHILARRKPHSAAIKVMDEEYLKELCKETPELEYPTLSTRFAMAQRLVALGVDINRVANVYRLVGPWVAMPIRLHEATALSHSKSSMDWDFVTTSFAQMIYSIRTSREGIEETYEDMIRQFQQPGQSVTPAS